MNILRNQIESLLQAENISAAPVMKNYETVYWPLAEWINTQQQQGKKIIGVNGAQGAGKSTLCKLLALLLQHGFGKAVAVLSLDDFYLTHAQRGELAKSVHPLLQTRGVPGTHDVPLAITVLRALKQGLPVNVPRFDKARDDRVEPIHELPLLHPPVDIILFEGWCVGARPQSSAQLQQPVNSLEAQEDDQAIWRQYVNARLANEYQVLFAMLDVLLMLKIPAFDKVYAWRALPESALKNGMNAQQLQRFVMHYERLTRHMLDDMPQYADKVLLIGDDHQPSLKFKV